MKILHVVGARPNFMKIAPIIREMSRFPQDFEQVLVHTGQHYDANMSQIFFEELGMPRPDLNLEVGSGSHAWQTAQIMLHFEPVVTEYKPDWVLVPGDVNSTMACALVCCKMGIKVAHIEAGLRSFDSSMPEEINRILTDRIAQLLFTPSRDADENLLKEGASPEKIHFVGNVMIDTLMDLLPKAEKRWPGWRKEVGARSYVLVTIHRPRNVDDNHSLAEIMGALNDLAQRLPVIFPVHPRTRNRIKTAGLPAVNNNLHLIEPLGYLDFLALQKHAGLVLTDSGGVQEETTFLGIPCLTVRPNTERPITISQGTNRLVATTREAIAGEAMECLIGAAKPRVVPELWDGKAASRIVTVFQNLKDN